jgi:hypothetical protein
LVEQPIRNRQVIGSSPIVGSIFKGSGRISSPKAAAPLLHKHFFFNRFIVSVTLRATVLM